VGEQIIDVLLAHHPVLFEQSKARKIKDDEYSIPKFAQHPFSEKRARERAKELLEIVGIHPDRLDDYPHQFSGGMRQRAVIAMTMALDPKMIIMDEPTTALDVVVERDIMAELAQLKKKFGFTILIISHDLSLMGEISDRIGVMYGGRMTEISTSEKVIYDPKHPYTVGLINSFPLLSEGKRRLTGIGGNPVNLFDPPKGCYFWPRCSKCMEICKTDVPQLKEIEPDRQVACHLYN
jgi:peptide/nickel transport system ATP-binding protein